MGGWDTLLPSHSRDFSKGRSLVTCEQVCRDLVVDFSDSGFFGAHQGSGDSVLQRTVQELPLQSCLAASTDEISNVGRKSLSTFLGGDNANRVMLCGCYTVAEQTPVTTGLRLSRLLDVLTELFRIASSRIFSVKKPRSEKKHGLKKHGRVSEKG